jgi:hypothetical protein
LRIFRYPEEEAAVRSHPILLLGQYQPNLLLELEAASAFDPGTSSGQVRGNLQIEVGHLALQEVDRCGSKDV